MPFGLIIVLLILVIGSVFSVKTEKLTPAAAATGSIIALLIFSGTGYTGLALMVLFFFCATIAGIIAKSRNPAYKVEKRDAKQVMANAGIAGLCGLGGIVDPVFSEQYLMMLSACFAAANSDTLSSELGMVYGSAYFDFRTGRKGVKGENGVVSLEGTIAGTFGAMIIAYSYCSLINNFNCFLFITVAGLTGNFSDTILGAFPERNYAISNNMVNAFCTFMAVLFVVLFG